jgi:anthranilate phosphoribosyltransferase
VPKTPEGEQVITHLLHHMLDYIAQGSVEPRHIAAVLYGLAKRGHPADELHRYAELALEHAEKCNLVEPMNPIDMAQLCFAIGRAGANGENMREALTSIASALIELRPPLQQRQAVVIAEAFRRARMQNEEFDTYLKEHL